MKVSLNNHRRAHLYRLLFFLFISCRVRDFSMKEELDMTNIITFSTAVSRKSLITYLARAQEGNWTQSSVYRSLEK